MGDRHLVVWFLGENVVGGCCGRQSCRNTGRDGRGQTCGRRSCRVLCWKRLNYMSTLFHDSVLSPSLKNCIQQVWFDLITGTLYDFLSFRSVLKPPSPLHLLLFPTPFFAIRSHLRLWWAAFAALSAWRASLALSSCGSRFLSKTFYLFRLLFLGPFHSTHFGE